MLKNITLNADSSLLEAARQRAQTEHKSLNSLFRDWLTGYARGNIRKGHYHEIMSRLSYAASGGRYTRQEMNER